MSDDQKRVRPGKKFVIPKAPHKETSYLAYLRTARPLLAKQHPDLPLTELTKRLAATWRDMDTAAKREHEDAAARANAAAAALAATGGRDNDRRNAGETFLAF